MATSDIHSGASDEHCHETPLTCKLRFNYVVQSSETRGAGNETKSIVTFRHRRRLAEHCTWLEHFGIGSVTLSDRSVMSCII